MKISTQQIQQIRERTGASIIQIRKALEDAGGDEVKALAILKKYGQALAAQKSSRQTRAGLVAAYIHSDQRIGAMVEVRAETDFVARNEEFQKLAKEIAMQVAAANPLYLRPEDVPRELIAEEKRVFREELAGIKKPANVIDEIIQGKLEKRFTEICLLKQPYIRNPDQTVEDFINEYIAKLGENIEVGKFCRMEL